MSGWQGSTRRQRLPANWDREIRPAVLARDEHQCRAFDRGARCGRWANEVDHIIPGDDHSMSNLQAICDDHHRRKSAAEGGRAAALVRGKRARPPERHPGVL